MRDSDYYASERVIHDDLVRVARRSLQGLKAAWGRTQTAEPSIFVWPSEKVRFHGVLTDGILPIRLGSDRAAWSNVLRDIVKQYNPYALLLVEPLEKEVVIIFESSHGTCSWHVPILPHGNVKLLGAPIEKADTDSIGLLWTPEHKRARN